MQQTELPATVRALRTIEARVAGQQHGPIARLISPDGLGERLKPFVFPDFFDAEIEPGFGFGMHPRSGIGTAKRYAHPLVVGPHSVHSNVRSLARGAEPIQTLRAELEVQGHLW